MKTNSGRPVDPADQARLAQQTIQEQESKDALIKWLRSHQWFSNRPDPDLGQDLWVEIYEERSFTGLSFYVQHKSALNIDDFKLKTSPELSYPIAVKDLLHWEKSAVIVVLIICSVKDEAERYWISIPSALQYLDAANPDWRNRAEPDAEVNVRIPLDRLLDANGLKQLRIEIADHYYPIQSQGKELEISYALANSEEGRRTAEALSRLFDRGEKIQLDSSGFTSFRLSRWFERMYGQVTFDRLTLEPKLPDMTIQTRMELETSDGSTVAIPYLEFKFTKLGRVEFTLSNEHQSISSYFAFTFEHTPDVSRANVEFLMRDQGSTIQEACELAEVSIGLARSSRLRLVSLATKEIFVDIPNPALVVNRSLDDLIQWKSLLDKLAYIQRRILRFGRIPFRGRITNADARDIIELHQILSTGKIAGKLNFKGTSSKLLGDKEAVEKILNANENPQMVLMFNESGYDIMGLEIPLGPKRLFIGDETALRYLRELTTQADPASKTELILKDVPVMAEYTDWLPAGSVEPASASEPSMP